MGVVNVTPDSFSDGGRFFNPDRAVAGALEMVRAGGVSAEEELERVAPVISTVRRETDVMVSIDTSKAKVAKWALEHGVDLVNDVSSLRAEPDIAELVAEAGAGLVLMHMKGIPRTMQESPTYHDVVVEVRDFLGDAASRAESAGVSPESILVDPGIGFGKTVEHNLQLVNRLSFLSSLRKPILIGTSRKSFIGRLLDIPVEDRLNGTAASVTASILRGAHIVRVHDVPDMLEVARIADAILNETGESGVPR
jgi:dihydropteroate synthase